VEVQVFEFLVDLFLIKDTNHRVFAMDGRHDRDTKVDVATFVTNPEATVLRHSTLGYVQLRHNLDTRDQRLVVSEIDWIDFRIKRSVNSILHLHFSVACFDMYVRRARLHRVINDRVDEFDDRRHLRVGREPVEIENFLAGFSFADERDAKSRCGLLKNTLRGIAATQDYFDRPGSGYVGNDSVVEGAGEF